MTADAIFRPIPGLRRANQLPGAAEFIDSTPLALLQRAAQRQPEAVALAGSAGCITFAELLDGMAKVAAAVAAAVPPGRAVACLLPQAPLGVLGALGCLVSGRVCLMLNPSEPDDRLAALLADAAPAALLLAKPRALPPGLLPLSLPELLAGPQQYRCAAAGAAATIAARSSDAPPASWSKVTCAWGKCARRSRKPATPRLRAT